MSLIEAAFKAFRSLWTPDIFAVMVKTIIVTLLCLCGFVAVVSWGIFHMSLQVSDPSIAWGIKWLVSLGSAVLAWFLFPGIMPVIVSFFDDKIANSIEAHDYRHELPVPRKEGGDFWRDMGFTCKTIFWNIICLPLYLVPVVNLVVFYLLNGYLLGREFFMMVARRHMAYAQAEQLRLQHSSTIFLSGVLFTFLATIPIINLVAPFYGVALAVHLFHQVYSEKQAMLAARAILSQQ